MRAFQDYLLGPLKAVLVRALQQQLAKYIHNIELEELGLMGGEIVLENLELKKDVLHESLRIPTDYDFSRGFIKELRIYVPWTRLQSRPIEIKFKTVEIIITPITHTSASRSSRSWLYSRTRSGEDQASSAGAASGWMQQLLTKVLANVSVSVSNLVLKYEDADVVVSAALKSLVCFSANPDRDWTPAFASLDDTLGLLHKLVRASDLTVCLDRYCAPDPAKRRQVQAFEVPIVNRASFDVRVLGCVWLVAPGPPESLLVSWEDNHDQHDQHAYHDADGQTGEDDGVAGPSSPETSSVRWGLMGDSPKSTATPKYWRAPVSVLGRLVGGDRRLGGSADESAVDGLSPEAPPAVLGTEGALDDLPLPCACRLLRDGWSRRASSSHSPFFDGDGVWSRSEATEFPVGSQPSAPQPQGVREEEAGGISGRDGRSGHWMPIPAVVADVVIDELCFSLSNLQVRMMEELIERAVHHVARNARQSAPAHSPAAEVAPRPLTKTPSTVGSSWWSSSYWRSSVPAGEEEGDVVGKDDRGGKSRDPKAYHGSRGDRSPVPSDSRGRDAKFVVASVSIASVSLRLLEHQVQQQQQRQRQKRQQAGGLEGTGEEEKNPKGEEVTVEVLFEEEEEEKEAVHDQAQSISVPVHGLGTVSVPSAPARARKPSLRPPVAFILAEVKGLALDANVLPGGDELSVDVQVEVSSIAVRRACRDDAAPAASDRLEPIVTWGEDEDCTSSEMSWSRTGDSARNVRRCLIERVRGLRRESSSVEASVDDAGSPASAGKSPEHPPLQYVNSSYSSQHGALLQPVGWRRTVPEGCALQYRLLKRREGGNGALGGAGGDDLVGATSTLACHDMAVGALRVRIDEALLERLLNFVGRRGSVGLESEEATQLEPESVVEESVDQRWGDARISAGTVPAWKSNMSLPPRPSSAGISSRPSSATTSETSLHLAIRSVEVALELPTVAATAATGGDNGENNTFEIGGGDSSALDRAAALFLVILLSRLEADGSESNTSVVAAGAPRYAWAPRRAAPSAGPQEENVCQRICSVFLNDLSVVVVDGSTLGAAAAAKQTRQIHGLTTPSLAERVFATAAGSELPALQRLVEVSGARANAKVMSTSSAGERVPEIAERVATRNPPEVLFNASCEALHVCSSRGAAVVILEASLLGTKVWSIIDVGNGGRESPQARVVPGVAPGRLWRHGIRASLLGVCAGGTSKDGGLQLMGNLSRLNVSRVGGGSSSESPWPCSVYSAIGAGVALFEALPGEVGGNGLSYTVEVAGRGRGPCKVKLTTEFKSAFIHYVRAKRAVLDLKKVTDEFKAAATAAGLFHDRGTAQGDAILASGRGGAPSGRTSVEFTIRGSSVIMLLPFDLRLEVDDVSVSTRPRSPRQPAIDDGSVDLDLAAGEVRVFQALHGASRWTPQNAQPPAITCSARGNVGTRTSANKVHVALVTERVRVRLTPRFCASFGMFVRFMVGPPKRPPPAADSTAPAAVPRAITPASFTFELWVREAEVDFLAGPCNPGGVSSHVLVGEVSMKQNTLGEASPGEGIKTSFEMAFQSLRGTQRRDARRNAPALPKVAAQLIDAFLGPTVDSGGGDGGGIERGVDVFLAWVARASLRKGEENKNGCCGKRRSLYVQPFIIPLGSSASTPRTRAFSVVAKTWGPRQRLVNSLSLRLAPVLLACYPPTFRELVSSYNRFGSNAFRSFRSRTDMPPRRIAIVHYDVDIRGCGVVLLASLANGARGIHVSAGVVEVKEGTASPSAGGSSPRGHDGHGPRRPLADGTVLDISGFIGPVEMMCVQDWQSLPVLSSEASRRGGGLGGLGGGAVPGSAVGAAVGGESESVARTTPLCVPIDVRWVVSYDREDQCRQDVSLSSVQFYLEQPHFDFCVRVAQIFLASNYAGALPPPKSSPKVASGPGCGRAEIDNFLAVSLRLSLLQIVLAMGKKNGPQPPVLEIDVASVRLTRGGVLTVRHVSVNSWPQGGWDTTSLPEAVMTTVATPIGRGDTGGGYCVLARSGPSEDSGKDFARMEVRVQEVPQKSRRRSLPPLLPQLDVVFQVEPFHVNVNPAFLRSLTSYVAPVPFAVESPEANEVPFPRPRPPFAAPYHPGTASPRHALGVDSVPGGEDDLGQDEGPVDGRSTEFERSAMTASASVRLLSSQLSLELSSSYPGGPAVVASTSHVFLRAVTWPPSDAIRKRSREEPPGERRRSDARAGAQAGPEMFARLTRVTCSVECSRGGDRDRGRSNDGGGGFGSSPVASPPLRLGAGGVSRPDQQLLTPLDVDVHVTRAASSDLSSGGPGCWHAAVAVDELSLKFGTAHIRSLELLTEEFLPVIAAAERVAAEFSREGSNQVGAPGSRRTRPQRRADDLLDLERVDNVIEFSGEAIAKPKPGQAVFYKMRGPREVDFRGAPDTAGEKQHGDGWVKCCEWRYHGLRRVVQVVLPYAPLRGSAQVYEGLVLDSLEVELSFLDPLTGTFVAATRFNVQCNRSRDYDAHRGPPATVEPSQPCFARTWRLAWRVPAWLRFIASSSEPLNPAAVSAWSSLLVRGLSVRSSPAGPAARPSRVSATLVTQRVALALLTDGEPSSKYLASSSSRGGTCLQSEEILRLTSSNVHAHFEVDAGATATETASAVWAASGSALVNAEVQDFGNFLRLPLLSHALLRWNVSGKGKDKEGGVGGDFDSGDLLSPFRPVVAAEAGVHGAVISVSVTAIQCLNRCIEELSPRRPRIYSAQAPTKGVGKELTIPGKAAPAGTGAGNTVQRLEASSLSSTSSSSISRQSRQNSSKRYVIENFTDRMLWFGQVATTETLLLRPGEDRSYRWRKIPAPVPVAGVSGGGRSRLGLLLRLALHHRRSDSGFGAWTEPFLADQAGTFMRLLRSAYPGERAGEGPRVTDESGADGVALPLWVTVAKEGLLTRVALHGEWVFTNHLPQEVQIAWATSAGVGNTGRGSGEPTGIRGGLTLVGCGPDKASEGLDPGQEAEVPSPTSSSALTACAPLTGTHGSQGKGWVSELMLEFRLAAPGASAVVGSVGPPPMPAVGAVATSSAVATGIREGGGDRGGGISSDGSARSRRDSEINGDSETGSVADAASSIGPWAVTRQSEWVEARSGVHVALISCASPELGSSGFWFWCMASRQMSPLSDCAGCVSVSTGHRCYHPGQMRVDLRPVAVVWNRCSQPIRAVLTGRGSRGGGWPERDANAKAPGAEEKHEQVRRCAPRTQEARVSAHGWRREVVCPYRPSGWKTGIQPGGRVAVCENPFLDHDIALSSPEGDEDGEPSAASVASSPGESYSRARPLLVSVPSELLSRRCTSSWLPLHERALIDNVLCPLVVVAARTVDAHWPSLLLRVYPGLSIQNHLPVALSLLAVFARPLPDGVDGERATGAKQGSVVDRRGNARGVAANDRSEDSGAPLLRPEVPRGKALSSRSSPKGSAGGGTNVSAPQDASPPSGRITRIFTAPAGSRHSAWDMFDDEGVPIPYLLPEVSLHIGLDASSGKSTAFIGDSDHKSDVEDTEAEPAVSRESGDAVTRRSRTLKFNLDGELNELVLVPWKPGSDAVIPAFVKMERESVFGGVELIRLDVHPRVVVHNCTGFPVSLSLLRRAHAFEDSGDGKGDGFGKTVPACRVNLAPGGTGSSMAVLALPAKGEGWGECGDDNRREDAEVRRTSTGSSRGGISRGFAWLLSSATHSAAPSQPPGFAANLEVALERDWSEKLGAANNPADGGLGNGDGDSELDDKLMEGGAASHGQSVIAVNRWNAVVSLHEASGGAPLRCEPARLTVATDGGRRSMGVCILAAEESPRTEGSPTRHVVLHHPPPSLVVVNRSAGPVTLLFDCGALVEVGPGCTAEHSWESATREERGGGGGISVGPSPVAQARSTSASSTPVSRRARRRSDTRSHGMSDAYSSPSQSPAAAKVKAAGAAAAGTPRKRSSFGSGSRNCAGGTTPQKARPPSKLGGDATLQHWFQCKGGRRADEYSCWSDPHWVAQGVQVIRFAKRAYIAEESHAEGRHFPAGEEDEEREVQMHIMERAGGFVMSFAEGGFEEGRPDADGIVATAGISSRGVLRRWASTVEQHVVVSVSGTIIQLIDETNLQAVAGGVKMESEIRARSTSSEGAGMVDGWIGGTWDGPSGLLSNGVSAQLPAAAIPAILSVFLDATSFRLWRAAPAARPGMTMLDLERSWHLKDRVGVDVSVGTLQIDNHCAGHSLPVLLCFRKGGHLVPSVALYDGQGEADGGRSSGEDRRGDCRLRASLVLAEPWEQEHSGVQPYVERLYLRSAPIDVCLEDVLVEPLMQFASLVDVSIFSTGDRGSPSPSPAGWARVNPSGPPFPSALSPTLQTRVFIQQVDIGALVVRSTVQGHIPGKQVFLSLDKSPLLFSPVVMRGVFARPDEIAEQIASNYAVDALLRSLAVVGSLEALGSPTTLLSEWGKGVYDLFAMPINAIPQGPSSTVRATFRGVSSLLRHASAGTLSSVSGVTNALSRNLQTRGSVVRPIAGTMGLVHRTSRSLIASTGVDSEWGHAKAATRATPAVCRLNADLWYRWCLLPPGHEFLYRTPALCSNASYSQATVPVTIVLSSQAVFLYRGGSGCEMLWKKIYHQDITLVEQSAEHAPVELILNARAYRRLRGAASATTATFPVAIDDAHPRIERPAADSTAVDTKNSNVGHVRVGVVEGRRGDERMATLGAEEEVEVWGLLMKLSLPNSACCRELAQLLHGLTGKA